MIGAKNTREEAIARAWAALTALLMQRGRAIEAGDEAALAIIDPRLVNVMQRGLKAVAIPRKPIKPNQTHRLVDYTHEVIVIETLILLMEDHGAEVPETLKDALQPLYEVIAQFTMS